MGKEGYSREGFFGEIIHYDSKGNKIGESRPGFWGDTYSNYDAKGNKIGETRPGLFGEYNTMTHTATKPGLLRRASLARTILMPTVIKMEQAIPAFWG